MKTMDDILATPDPIPDHVMPNGLRLRIELTLAERDAEIERLRAEREDFLTPRPIDDWHEDKGNVLWWVFPVSEPPYCGMPIDTDWPGYHTHWTPLPPAFLVEHRAKALSPSRTEETKP